MDLDLDLDLEQIAIVLQRRYTCLREVQRITQDMKGAIARHDEVSVALLLNMRGQELSRYDASQEELWSQAAKGYAQLQEMNRLLKSEPETIQTGSDPMEIKIVELRKKTRRLIQEIQSEEKSIKRRITGKE